MYEKKIQEDLDCGITITMKVFGAKWKPCIIDAIGKGAKRPSELHRMIMEATPRVIDMQLSELVEYGIVARNAQKGFPLYTEYSLTPLGKTMVPIVSMMDEWGLGNRDHVKAITEKLTLNPAGLR